MKFETNFKAYKFNPRKVISRRDVRQMKDNSWQIVKQTKPD